MPGKFASRPGKPQTKACPAKRHGVKILLRAALVCWSSADRYRSSKPVGRLRAHSMTLLRYFGSLPPRKLILWCYLIWYLVTVVFLFDPSPALWLNSAGISLVIGIALQLSVSAASPRERRWQTFRLFLMPFCVSSFAALIKGQGYVLILPTRIPILVCSVCACTAFAVAAFALKKFVSSNSATDTV